jgi:Lysylphosphatidylglycerol synthase TM region
MERVDSAWSTTRHAVELVISDVVAVAPGWLAAGVVLHLLHQVVRTRGWFNIIRAAYPDAAELRARDVTLAYLAGSGLNGLVPARGGDAAKLYLIRRRAPRTHWSTLAATFVPETLFETAVGAGLLVWAVSQGLLPVPAVSSDLHELEASFVRHPFLSVAGVAAVGASCVVTWLRLRRRASHALVRVRSGLAICHRPREFLLGVVVWQALGRVIRLGSLAALLAAFALPVTVATVMLVMATQGGGRIVPSAPARAGLRVALLTYGIAAITGEVIDTAHIIAFSFGVAATLSLVGLTIAMVILGRELGTVSPRTVARRLREQVRDAPPVPAAAAPPSAQ